MHEHEMSGLMWHPTLPPTFMRVIDWHRQPIPIIVILAAFGLALYVFCVWLLHRRGVRWPASRLSRRLDRQPARDGNADLRAYNAYLVTARSRPPRPTTTGPARRDRGGLRGGTARCQSHRRDV